MNRWLHAFAVCCAVMAFCLAGFSLLRADAIRPLPGGLSGGGTGAVDSVSGSDGIQANGVQGVAQTGPVTLDLAGTLTFDTIQSNGGQPITLNAANGTVAVAPGDTLTADSATIATITATTVNVDVITARTAATPVSIRETSGVTIGDDSNTAATVTTITPGTNTATISIAGTGRLIIDSSDILTVSNLGTAADTDGDLAVRQGGVYDGFAKGSNSTVLQVSAGGVLQYGTITSAMITDLTITDADVAAANKDGAQGTPSMRTLTGPPAALGTSASTGSSQTGSPSDHVHAAPSVTINSTAHGATTTLNVSSGADLSSSTASGTTRVTISAPVFISGGYLDRPTGSNSLHFVPHVSDRAFCYENSAWIQKRIPSLIATMATGLTANTTYNAYIADLDGDHVIDNLELSTTSPVTVTGIQVKDGQPFRTYIARCSTNGSGNITGFRQDASTHLICNAYNKRKVTLYRRAADSSAWTLNSTTIRVWNANTANKCSFVTDGVSGVRASVNQGVSDAVGDNTGYVGVGLDSSAIMSAQIMNRGAINTSVNNSVSAFYADTPAAGYHDLWLVEACANTLRNVTFQGDNGVNVRPGMTMEIDL